MSCPFCDDTNAQLEKLTLEVSDYERDLKGKRATIRRLEAELAQSRAQHKRKPEADEVFAYWKETVAPKAREFSGDRLKNVLARLDAGYDVETLKRAVDGARVGAFRSEKGVTFNDLELICRSASKVDSFIARAEAHDRRQEVAQRARPAGDEGRPDVQPLPVQLALDGYVTNLASKPKVLERIRELKGWKRETLEALGVGWDGRRFTIPVRDAAGELVNLLRYVPGGEPKLVSLRGRPRDLFPRPEDYPVVRPIVLCEGETDALAGRSYGLQTVAVPGVNGWRDDMAVRFEGRTVHVVFDCDKEGRTAARSIAAQLTDAGAVVRLYDLAPARADKYDLSDSLLAGQDSETWVRVAIPKGVAAPPRDIRVPLEDRRPINADPVLGVLEALERHGCNWKAVGRDQWQGQCPAHADRAPSLSIRQVQGDEDVKVLLNCFAGCTAGAVLEALGLPWSELFGAVA